MAERGAQYPSVYVVDSRAAIPPLPPKPGQRRIQNQRTRVIQTMLILLVSMALFGIAVEACFIYNLYHSKKTSQISKEHDSPQISARKDNRVEIEQKVSTNPPKTRPPAFLKPHKPVTHLTAGAERPGKDGVMPWSVNSEHDLHGLEYTDGKLVVQKEGYYYIYSKLCYYIDEVKFYYAVVMTTQRYQSPHPTELIRYRYHSNQDKQARKSGSLTSSYLGGVFHLYKKDVVFVLVRNGTVCLQNAADNYFGMFML